MWYFDPRYILNKGVYTSYVSQIDTDAQAFITAAGITDATQIAAINRLVKNYKGVGDLNASVDLWTGESIIYPMVGGTAATCKFNLKNPVDSDAANRISFIGGWTFDANGPTPNGTNAYARTFFIPNTLGQNNASLSFYSRSNSSGPSYALGCSVGSFDSCFSTLHP